MARLKLLCALACGLSCIAQEAAIYKIPETDANRGRRLYERFKSAEAEYDTWKRNLEQGIACGEKLKFSRDFEIAIPESGEGTCASGASSGSWMPGLVTETNEAAPVKGDACAKDSPWNCTILGRTLYSVAYWDCENGQWAIRNDNQ